MYLPVKPVGLKMISASSGLAAKAEPIRYSAAFQPTKQNQPDTLPNASQLNRTNQILCRIPAN